MQSGAKSFAITGAGLVGALLGVLLAKRGHYVDIYERRPDFRDGNMIGGRSINLALSDRGWKGLRLAGLEDEIRKLAIPMKGRMMHDEAGKLTFQPYGLESQSIYSVSRSLLNLKLIQAADAHERVNLHFNHRCETVDFDEPSVKFTNMNNNGIRTISPDFLIGADGAFSMVRLSMQKRPRFNYQQFYLDHGYKELTMHPNADGSHKMELNALHIWPRKQFMMIALPNPDGSFTCTLFLAYEGDVSFAAIQNDADITAFFEKYFADIIPLMPNLVEDFNTNPTADLVTVRCSPWQAENKTLLIGDAAHAIVPFYGQGMNAGFEDCSILYEMADELQDDWEQVIEKFSRNRIPDGNAISELALRNFIEMRDQVADPAFLLRKKIANYYHEKYPDKFIPMYSMVTFSHIPYRFALEEAQAQDVFFGELLQMPGIEENYKSEAVENRLLSWVATRPKYI